MDIISVPESRSEFMSTNWTNTSACQDTERDTLYHVQFDCEEHVLSFHQNKSLTGNYLVLTNSLEVYSQYVNSLLKDGFIDSFETNYSETPINEFFCKLIIGRNIQVQYGIPKGIIEGNAELMVVEGEFERSYKASKDIKGKINAKNRERTFALQLIEEISGNLSHTAFIIPIKGMII